ncbi:hypothetical protein [Streptomyces parvulus]|uniref:Uncharacterized protein n=1 Tax=Streptomyces parvulus TaxID=146923 RepID=A0A369V4B6_9ACTN|nr:hypothetical protein [Streptomyces parvulus]RDD87854.1 hypothetical protein DVZ84_17410 [Streptomyces parvulus]
MPSKDKVLEEVTRTENIEIDAVLDPAEPDGVFRDSRECAALALQSGAGNLLLSPPTPRPKKG